MSTPANQSQLWFAELLIPQNTDYWQRTAAKLAAGEFTEEDVDEVLRRTPRGEWDAAEAAVKQKIYEAKLAAAMAEEEAAAAAAAAEATAGEEPAT
jgi:hypothetical protein